MAEIRIIKIMGQLHVDLFLQDRLLPNGVDIKIRLVRSKDTFPLMAGCGDPDFDVHIIDANMFARKDEFGQPVAHRKALDKAMAKYPQQPV